jgi:SnoaL-like domain
MSASNTRSDVTAEQSVVTARGTADAIAAAMTAGDHGALMALYADDVTFHSPVTAVEFRGKDEVGALMAHVMVGFEHWERTFVLADDQRCVFGARGRIGGRSVELAEFIRLDSDGRVSEIRIHGRPLAGLAAIAAVAAPKLAARRGRGRARLVGLLSRGLPSALARGDELITRLAR